jgi:L-lactate dehydrogenase complex protein LldG
MNPSLSKENIIKKIRAALSTPTPLPYPKSEGSSSLFQPSTGELELLFAEEFTRLQGKFVFCVSWQELTVQVEELIKHRQWNKVFCSETHLQNRLQKANLSMPLTNSLVHCDVSITSCEALVARTGSLVLSSSNESGRTASVYAPVHICIASSSQLVYDVRDALQVLKEKYDEKLPSLISFATGPSRTADIEKTLVVGVHGPKEVFVLLTDEE